MVQQYVAKSSRKYIKRFQFNRNRHSSNSSSTLNIPSKLRPRKWRFSSRPFLLVLQFRFGDKLLGNRVLCPQNGTAVLKKRVKESTRLLLYYTNNICAVASIMQIFHSVVMLYHVHAVLLLCMVFDAFLCHPPPIPAHHWQGAQPTNPVCESKDGLKTADYQMNRIATGSGVGQPSSKKCHVDPRAVQTLRCVPAFLVQDADAHT